MRQEIKLDIVCIENALMDVTVPVTEQQLSQIEVVKGSMRLINQDTLSQLLQKVLTFSTTPSQEMGGAGGNVMRGLAMLGGKCCYSSAIGDDNMGRLYAARMEQHGVTNRLVTINEGHTGTCIICVTPDGERTLNTHLGACQHYCVPFIPLQDIASSRFFFSTGYMLDTPLQMEAFWQAVAHAKKHNVKCVFDVGDGFVIDRHGQEYMQNICKQMDVVFCNRQEGLALLGCGGVEGAKKLSQFCPLAIMKDSENGAYVVADNQEPLHIPARHVSHVRDTTGAGDFFAAGFLYGLLNDWDLLRSGQLAVNMASDTLQHMGAVLSSDVKKYLSL